MSEAISKTRTVTAELWGDGRGWVLLAVSIGWFLSYGVRMVYPIFAPFFQAEFGLTLTTTGLLLSTLWGAYALGQIPGGILGDRIGEGRILVISSVISGVAIAVVAASIDVWMLFVGTIGFGFATALFGPTRFTVFTDLYSKRTGSAIGLTMAAGSAGNTVLPVVTAVLATSLTWRLSFGSLIPLFAVATVALWVFVPARTSSESSAVDDFSRETITHILESISGNSIPVVVAIQMCFSFAFQGFVSFYPTFLTDVKDLSPSVAATLFGIFFASSFAVQPLSGIGMDRFGARSTLIGVLGIGCLGLWLLPFVSGTLPLASLTIVVSVISGCAVLTQTHIAASLPEDVQGTGMGTVKASWMLVGATSPLIIGVLGDLGHFTAGFVVLAVLATIGLLLTVVRL